MGWRGVDARSYYPEIGTSTLTAVGCTVRATTRHTDSEQRRTMPPLQPVLTGVDPEGEGPKRFAYASTTQPPGEVDPPLPNATD